MRKKVLIAVCMCALAAAAVLTVKLLPQKMQPVAPEDDILIGLTPAYSIIERSEWYESQTESEYFGINNTKSHGVDEDVSPRFYDRNASVLQFTLYADSDVVQEWPDNVYGEKWAFESLENGPKDMDKGIVSALHFLSTIQFLSSERQNGVYEDFMPNTDFIHFALHYMDYEYIWTELSDGFVLEFIGGVQIRFYVNEEREIPYAQLIVQDIANSQSEPMILEVNLQTKAMFEGESFPVPPRKSTLITQPAPIIAEEEFPLSIEELLYMRTEFPFDRKLGPVQTAEDAAKHALPILLEVYGESILDELPFKIYEDKENGLWLVSGTLKENMLGGTAKILIRRFDGDVLAVWHDK